MKILFYNHTGKASGAERLLLMILSRIDRARFEPLVVCPGDDSLAALVAELGVPVQTVPSLQARFTWRPDFLLRYFQSFVGVITKVRGQVKSFSPDLIHANSIRSGLVATAATMGLGTRVVWHLHDLLPRHPLSTAIRVFALSSRRTRMIAVSRAVADNFRGAWRPLGQRISTILNAIDLDRFQTQAQTKQVKRAELQVSETALLIGIVGQITPRKGQLELLRAFVQVVAELPQAVLLVVGAPLFNRDHEYGELLEQTVTELGLEKNVRLLGARDDVAALMQALDLLVINSAAEPFGLVALEAMACGTPVVATDTGGLPEIITHGKDGYLVPLHDEAALAAAIISLGRQPILRAALVKEGRKKVAARFNSERFMRELQSFYLDSLSAAEPVTSRPASNQANRTAATRLGAANEPELTTADSWTLK